MFHSFLSLLPPLPFICGLGLAGLFLAIINTGFLAMFGALILALGLIFVEELSEGYDVSKLLISAIQEKLSFGVGDIRLVNVTKKLLPRLSYYYVGVSAILLSLAIGLPYIWPYVLWPLAVFLGFAFQIGAMAGPENPLLIPLCWMVAILLYSAEIAVGVFLLTRAKRLIFGMTPKQEWS